jgi:hypothetical protein
MIMRSPFDPVRLGAAPGTAISAFFGYMKGVNNELAMKHVPLVTPRNDSVAGPVGRRGDQVCTPPSPSRCSVSIYISLYLSFLFSLSISLCVYIYVCVCVLCACSHHSVTLIRCPRHADMHNCVFSMLIFLTWMNTTIIVVTKNKSQQ